MQLFNKILPQGGGLANALLRRAPCVCLDWDVRQKSRFDATTSEGNVVGVFIARGCVLRGGDVLVSTQGDLLRVVAADQPVLRITPCAEHGRPFDLVRAAYHLGNRHVPIELTPTHLHIEPDHVLADMLREMHLTVAQAQSAFEPESGAYGDHSAHQHADKGHTQNHSHSHSHSQGHDDGHLHDNGHAHG